VFDLAIAPLTFSIPAEVQNRIQERKELIREQKELDMEARLQLRESWKNAFSLEGKGCTLMCPPSWKAIVLLCQLDLLVRY
jgi:hypothetical protein